MDSRFRGIDVSLRCALGNRYRRAELGFAKQQRGELGGDAGLATGQLMLAVIGVFVFLGATAEMKAEQFGHSLGDVPAGRALNPNAVVLLPASTLAEGLQAVVSTGQSALAVVHFNRLVGVVGKRELLASLQTEGPHGYVTGTMKRDVPHIEASETLEVARLKMNESLSPAVAVYEGEQFLGLITEVELAQALMLSQGKKAKNGSAGRRVTVTPRYQGR